MEELLDYLIYALCGHEYDVEPIGVSCVNYCRQWLLTFCDEVTIVLNEHDIRLLKYLCVSRALDEESRLRYEKLFLKCC